MTRLRGVGENRFIDHIVKRPAREIGIASVHSGALARAWRIYGIRG